MPTRRRWLPRALVLLAIVVVSLVGWVWYTIFRAVPQRKSITSDPATKFLYGSIGTETRGGIPYWIVVVLPRIFDDLLPGPGGYAALGLPWQEGAELPAGFSKRTVGYDRVGFNCALCHTAQYRLDAEATPTIVAGGGNNAADIDGLGEFFTRAANDSRFGADAILREIDMSYRLSLTDRLLYQFVLIPRTKKRLREHAHDILWAAHGRRRGVTIPAIWGRGALPAPRYPLSVDSGLAARGKPVFQQYCAGCHARSADNRPGAAPPLDGVWLRAPYLRNGSIPTIRALLDPAERRPATFYRGYDVLDRSAVGFVSRRCAGDQAGADCMPSDQGWLYNTADHGHGNGDHLYGTTLSDGVKAALIEYLKTL